MTDDGSSAEACRYVENLLQNIEQAGNIRCRFLTHLRTSPYRLNTIRNRGIEQANGALILLLDGDMLLPKGFLGAHLEVHAELAGLGQRGYVSSTRKNLCPNGELQESRFSRWGHELDRFLQGQDWRELDLDPKQILSQATFHRSDWEQVGGFDPDFDGYWGFDEVEFAWRLKLAGVRLTCHGQLIHIDEGPGAGNRDCTRNQALYKAKCASAALTSKAG